MNELPIEVSALEIKPNEYLVFRVDRSVSSCAVDRLLASLRDQLPHAKGRVLVMSKDIEIEKIRFED